MNQAASSSPPSPAPYITYAYIYGFIYQEESAERACKERRGRAESLRGVREREAQEHEAALIIITWLYYYYYIIERERGE